MFVSGLWLQDFRSYSEKIIQFSPGLNIIQASNGSGKSNILEALRLLSIGQSWRSGAIEDLIRWDQELGRAKARVVQNEEKEEVVELEVILTHGIVQGKKTNKRLYRVGGASKRKENFVGQFATVLFTPEDMGVFQAGPSQRRQLLDTFLEQIDVQYRRSLKTYEQALRRRNKLILQLREGEVDRYAFFYWDQLLVEHGEVIHNARQNLLQWLQEQEGIKENYSFHYDHSLVTEERLHQYAQAEVGAGHTLVGPHKDDWILQVTRNNEQKDIASFASRGEQRLALVWWKLMETRYLQTFKNVEPVILLDDVLSELDDHNSEHLLGNLGKSQIILTSAENEPIFSQANVLHLNDKTYE